MQPAFTFVKTFSSNETVGELVQILEDENIPNGTLSAAASHADLIASSTTEFLAARSFPTPRVSLSPVDKLRGQRTLNAFYNSTDHGGYNLTIPGCLAADDIIGQVEAPNGTLITNASFGDLINILQLPGDALYNYTLTFANQTFNNINATLNAIICEGPQGATRNLLWPPSLRPNWRDPDNSEGFWTAYIIGGLGVTGIGYGGTHLAVIHEGITANISLEVEVRILAATGLMQFVFLTLLWRLQSVQRRWIGRGEAVILNSFIWVGAQLLKFLEAVSGSTCISTTTAREGIGNLMARAQNQVQVITTGANTMVQSLSSTFLLGLNEQAQSSSGDIESQAHAVGQEMGSQLGAQMGAQVAQAAAEGLAQVAQAATQLTPEQIQNQLTGGNPGETCG